MLAKYNLHINTSNRNLRFKTAVFSREKGRTSLSTEFLTELHCRHRFVVSVFCVS